MLHRQFTRVLAGRAEARSAAAEPDVDSVAGLDGTTHAISTLLALA